MCSIVQPLFTLKTLLIILIKILFISNVLRKYYRPFQIHFTSNKDNKEIQNETFKKVTAFRKVSIKYKETISLNFYDFVNRTMTKDLKSRMSMREVLQHPWIISNGDNVVI